MKKFMLLLCALFTLAVPVSAADNLNENVTVVVFGKTMTDKGVIIDGRTFIPVREIFETMGFDVGYDAETKTATVGYGDYIMGEIKNGESYIKKGEKQIELEAPQRIVNDKFMIPLRAVLNFYAVDIEWDGETKTATISEHPGISDLTVIRKTVTAEE